MNTRKVAKEYRLSHWAEIMQERAASGMNIKMFCESKGFHPNIYYYWQRKLREAACRELIPAEKNNDDKNALVPKGWAVCEVVDSEPKNNAIFIEVGKFKIAVDNDSSPELLDKICKVLVPLC